MGLFSFISINPEICLNKHWKVYNFWDTYQFKNFIILLSEIPVNNSEENLINISLNCLNIPLCQLLLRYSLDFAILDQVKLPAFWYWLKIAKIQTSLFLKILMLIAELLQRQSLLWLSSLGNQVVFFCTNFIRFLEIWYTKMLGKLIDHRYYSSKSVGNP